MSKRCVWLLARFFCLAFPGVGQVAQAQAGPSLSNTAVASEQANSTPSPGTDQRPVVQGQLPNGLRYAILPRRGNEPGVSLRIRVAGGFLSEQRPGERGLAHLIEHLIFHSPTRTAPNELRRFRQVGMPLALPEPAGGTTTWRESDYFVVSRTSQPADIDTLLELFREVFSELTFRVDALDEQRAEVIREMSDKRLGNDIYADYIAALAPNSPTDVIEAQNSDDVSTASVETIRALYNRLYRPENVMVVLVGDVDAAEAKALIERRFGNWKGSGAIPSHTPIPTFRPDRIEPISYSEFKYGRNVAMVTVTSRLQPVLPSRREQMEARLMDLLAMRAVNDRLALSQTGFPPGKYGVFIENGEQGHRLINLWDNFAPGQWRSAVGGLKEFTCDLNTVDFTDAEWISAKQNLLQDLAGRVEAMPSVPNFELARELSDTLTDGRQPIATGELLTYARSWLPTLDAREGSDWWRRQWNTGTEHIRVETPELVRVSDPATAIRAIADEAVQSLGCKVRPS